MVPVWDCDEDCSIMMGGEVEVDGLELKLTNRLYVEYGKIICKVDDFVALIEDCEMLPV